jgi:hypothetical protein
LAKRKTVLKPETEPWVPPQVRALKAKNAPPPELLVKEPPVNVDLVTDTDFCRILKAIATFDGRRLLRSDGSSVDITELDYYTAIAISGLEMAEFYGPEEGATGDRRARVNLGVLKKFKLADRFKAIELLWRYEGKLRDDAPHRAGDAASLLPPVVNINFVQVNKSIQ